MELLHFARQRRWVPLLGYLFFIGMMATGYIYNLTFIQFGLLDLGTRLVGLGQQQVAANMAVLALVTSAVAVLTGWLMMRRGWSRRLQVKLRMAFASVLILTVLTAAVPAVRTPAAFLGWIVAASVGLGLGVPATFGLTVDLVPVRYRGYAGAWITAAAYFPAAVLSANWTVEQFRAGLLGIMVAGTAGLGVVAFGLPDLVGRLAAQHQQPAYGVGRFVHVDARGRARVRRSLFALFALMFGIYFVDSLGFLRLADTPFLFEAAWRSPDTQVRLAIGVTHVIAAVIGGLLYTALNEKELFLWVFGIFALVHLMYSATARRPPADGPTLAPALLYALAVSLYTVINFAIWADISTPDTISRNAALGVALSAWTATFISTALALQMSLAGVSLDLHLRIVDAVAILFFLLVGLLIFFAPAPARREASR